MKKLHIVLFSVLFLAIALLYVLFFTGKDGARDDTPGSALVHSDAQGIAFVSID